MKVLIIILCILGYLLIGFEVCFLWIKKIILNKEKHEFDNEEYDPAMAFIITIAWPIEIILKFVLFLINITFTMYNNIYLKLYKKYTSKDKIDDSTT